MKHRLLFLILAAPAVFFGIQWTSYVSFVKAAGISGGKIESPPEKASVASKAVTQDKAVAASVEQETGQNVAFGEPIKGALPGDPLQLLMPPSLRGLLVSLFEVDGSDPGKPTQTYMTLRRFHGTEKADAPADIANYLVKPFVKKRNGRSFYKVYNVIPSPDGHYVLFKYGDPYGRHGSYFLYVMDLATRQIKLVSPRELSYRDVAWSPDGNYIAYLEGGDWQGNVYEYWPDQTIYLGGLSLYVCNWKTGKEQLVVNNDTLKTGFAWAAPHALLYGTLSEAGQKALRDRIKSNGTNGQDETKPKSAVAKAEIASRPDIYEYSVESRKSKLLIKAGCRPLPSPDGKWIAFFGSEHPNKPTLLDQDWMDRSGGAALMVARRNGSGRKTLNLEKESYPPVQWQPDSRSVLTLHEVQDVRPEPEESPSPFTRRYNYGTEGQIAEWDIGTGRRREIATLHIKDYEPQTPGGSKFKLLGVSRNGQFILVSASQTTGKMPDSSYPKGYSYLQAVAAGGGAATTIARLSWPVDWHWHEESTDTRNKK